MHKVGFIGLGNVGSKLAGILLKNGVELTVLDLNDNLVEGFVAKGAKAGTSPSQLARDNDFLITCLPSPKISAQVIEGNDGALEHLRKGKIWLEMSTTDHTEITRLGKIVIDNGAEVVDCPVSGGCHRAATGNISIFAGCDRSTFDRILPLLKLMGRRILHTGELGSASILKVVTNYLATANLVSCCEALVVSKAAGMDLATAYEAIKISSGNSFVHETESQVILNGSRDISFTMDLVLKDIGLFKQVAENNNVKLELGDLLIDIFKDGIDKYGTRELSPNIIRRLEDVTRVKVLSDGFPAEMVDDEPEVIGSEIVPKNR